MKKVVLVIMDGWGISNERVGNAIQNAQTPNIDKFVTYYPNTALQASGISVGLPYGKMGNSEVGHLTIGAGKILYQNLPKVTLSIQDRSFFEKKALLDSIQHAKENNCNIHLMGLVSTGGVHSHMDHLYALLGLLKEHGMDSEKVFIHVFTDGRDVSPESSIEFVKDLESSIESEGFPGKIASITGRYYAMDRNENWDRIQKAYYCMVNGVGAIGTSAEEIIKASYAKGVTDEFIEPTLIKDEQGKINTIKPKDSVIFFNIREDRARQLTKSFVLEDFNFFDRGGKLPELFFVTMMEYEKGLPVNVVFPPEEVKNPLGKVLSERGLKQLRIAETEKYAHVTYFFNGGKEDPFPGEFRTMVPSPSVSDYIKTPKMSAEEITEQVVAEIEKGTYDFILLNFANADMIGHTGDIDAAIQAVECVDQCIGKVYDAIMKNNSVLIATADHGNAEEMVDFKTGRNLTEHSSNPVPFILVDPDRQYHTPRMLAKTTVGGMLSDIAPTILDIMDIEKPSEMTGTSLLTSI
jgi:2,3-bisphosphoglycerate-independent phosphoglycerate mutase